MLGRLPNVFLWVEEFFDHWLFHTDMLMPPKAWMESSRSKADVTLSVLPRNLENQSVLRSTGLS